MSSNLALQLENDELEQKALSVPQQAQELIILDEESYKKGSEILLTIKDLRKEIQDTFKPIKEKAHAAWKEVVAQEKRHDEPLIEAERILKPKISSYHDMLEQKRREEEERARQEALKQAEEARLQDAVAAEQLGQSEIAESILEGPTYIPTVVVPKAQPSPQGVSFRENYKSEVFDMKALVVAVAQGKVPLNVLEANMTVLNGLARSLKGALNYPGVRVVCEKVVAAGRR